ncbi:MAG: chorismate-binding protein [Muribaculaceae bacterium]|nr:chorismate-binding protein [Muribaculaceae bacterium]MDE7080619.1 chorismate-binding protein [Muribaculaceae bacterium]
MNLFRIAFPTSRAGFLKTEFESRISYYGTAEELTEGLPRRGFFFSRFGIDAPIYGIPLKSESSLPYERLTDNRRINAICEANDSLCPPELSSTSRPTHLQLVEDIRTHLRRADDGSPEAHRKIVAARVSRHDMAGSPTQIYNRLCHEYPQACVFLFSTPLTGTWIGASPELLLNLSGSRVSTVALAGTRPAGTPAGTPWDRKNIDEQKIVADFILSTLREEGLDPKISDTFTLRAGKVEHICNKIAAKIPSSGLLRLRDPRREENAILINTLLRRLSPTPALSGFPQQEAVDYINAHEQNPRGYYGGIIGFNTPRSATAYVNLRSARLDAATHTAWLYAGGGITRDSVPEEEWEETCRKISTLADCM